MAQHQNPKKALKCTYRNCQELQDAEGEFCPKHYNTKFCNWCEQDYEPTNSDTRCPNCGNHT